MASIEKLRKMSEKKKCQTGNTKVGVELVGATQKKKFTGGNDLSKKGDYFFIHAIYGSYLNNVIARIKHTHGFRSSIPEIISGRSTRAISNESDHTFCLPKKTFSW